MQEFHSLDSKLHKPEAVYEGNSAGVTRRGAHKLEGGVVEEGGGGVGAAGEGAACGVGGGGGGGGGELAHHHLGKMLAYPMC